MKRTIAVILAAILCLSILAACGGGGGGGSNTQAEKKSVVLLGSNYGDKSFFDSARTGVERVAADFGDVYTTDIVDITNDTTKYDTALLEASDKSPEIIVVGTFNMHDPLTAAAPQYPDVKYIIFDDQIEGMDNVYSCLFNANQASYLAGMIAAKTSKTGTVGFVGGMDNTPIIWDFLIGYIEGAQSVNPGIKVAVSYANDFSNSAKAKELALAQINTNNADVLFSVAGASGAGTIEACAEAGKYVIGVDSDQAAQYEGRPEYDAIITSALKRVDNAIYQAIERAKNGEFKGGYEMLGIDRDCVGIVIDDNTRKVVDEAFIGEVESAIEKMKSGEIVVSSAFAL
ncbi:MAG: BMP family ABC transporter substrate-binding protein, partial [Clostridiales bacterium]|nr:BMP family ABC transporter substrate-binding protein [Clostridiales bacterium]